MQIKLPQLTTSLIVDDLFSLLDAIMTRFTLTTFATMIAILASFVTLASGQQIRIGIEDYVDLNVDARMSVMTTDPNGRLFVNDQQGSLYLIDRNAADDRASRNVIEYLDFANSTLYPSIQLRPGNEPGFQSFTFHPDFANLGTSGFGKFYTMHSSDNNADPALPPDFVTGANNAFHSVLLEWETSDPFANAFAAADSDNPFREVARFQQPFNNHNAGLIAFNTSVSAGDGDYGNLYVALGDGGGSNDPENNARNTGNPFGAILRIDPLGDELADRSYNIVSDNIFAADSDANTLGEIFSYGLRNPQRFGWDSENGDMYIADIGQGAFEEINLGQNGGNFGWDLREGSQGETVAGAIDPVAAYSHSGFVSDPITGGRAVTVGEVVRGGLLPELEGQLLLGDFPNGVLYTLDVDGTDTLDGGQDDLLELQLVDAATGTDVRLIELIRSQPGLMNQGRADLRFSVGTGGEVFILNKHDGIVRRLVSLTAVPESPALAFIAIGAAAVVSRRRR